MGVVVGRGLWWWRAVIPSLALGASWRVAVNCGIHKAPSASEGFGVVAGRALRWWQAVIPSLALGAS